MGDSQATIEGGSPLESWPNRAARQPGAPAAAVGSAGAQRSAMPRAESVGQSYAQSYGPSHGPGHGPGHGQDRTRVDLPALSGHAGGDAPGQSLDPQAPPIWPGPAAQAPAIPQPPMPPGAPPMTPMAPLSHAPWTVAASWGASSLNTPNMLAGSSYLFWWVSGLFVYFNERHNRFVRFHAVQSILLTGALTVVSVILYILWELSGDLSAATRQPAFAHVGQGIALLGFLAVIALWLGPMFAAWSGHHVRLPIVGAYAERYAAPPREPYPPAPFTD